MNKLLTFGFERGMIRKSEEIMGLYKRKGIWYIRIKYEGKEIRQSTRTRNRKIAQRALDSLKGKIAQGKFDIQDMRRTIFFDELCDIYIDYAKVNKKSWERDVISINNLKQSFGGIRLNEISALQIEEYKQMRMEKVKPATVNREIACMKHMFYLGIEWDKTSKNPVKGVKLLKERNQRIRFLSKDEIDRLLLACPEHLKPLVMTALYTGMRRGEIFNLRWKDVDFKRNCLILDETKSGVSRKIPIHDTLREILLGLASRGKSEHVFLNRNGDPYKDVKTPFRNALKRAAIEGVTFHTLRHTFASQLVMANVNMRTIQELMGHKTMKMTVRYSHLSEEYKERAINILGRRLGTTGGHKNGTQGILGQKEKAEKP